jgi:7-cyano-7-deazaguanine synthase
MIHVSLSGGLDSSVCAALAVERAGAEGVTAVSFDYGQRHRRELDSARRVAAHLGISHEVVDIAGLLHGSSLLGAAEVPDGHYAEESMRITVVNGRNLLFASVLISRTEPGDEVWLAVHGGDHFIYPDCRPSFVDPLAEAVFAAYEVRIVTPFLVGDKAGIARLSGSYPGLAGLSWSCYKGGEIHCGRCGTCVERREAFLEAGIPDPTAYESLAPLPARPGRPGGPAPP